MDSGVHMNGPFCPLNKSGRFSSGQCLSGKVAGSAEFGKSGDVGECRCYDCRKRVALNGQRKCGCPPWMVQIGSQQGLTLGFACQLQARILQQFKMIGTQCLNEQLSRGKRKGEGQRGNVACRCPIVVADFSCLDEHGVALGASFGNDKTCPRYFRLRIVLLNNHIQIAELQFRQNQRDRERGKGIGQRRGRSHSPPYYIDLSPSHKHYTECIRIMGTS